MELRVTCSRSWDGNKNQQHAGFCKAISPNLKFQAKENPPNPAITVIPTPPEDCSDVCTHASVISMLKQESASMAAGSFSISGA